MKRAALMIAGVLAIAIGGWMYAQTASAPVPLASLMPGGPLLYIETRDFSALLREWNGSQVKRAWLASDNYAVFSRSRLLQRLEVEQTAFAGTAGFTADMALLNTVAGGQSALALYDIGELAFLYVSRAPASKIAGSVLARAQSSYESRTAAGRNYFVRRSGDKTAVFASTDGLLLLATREDLMTSALALLAKQSNTRALTADTWFATASAASTTPGEVRLVLNMPSLLASPHFRSYWIQRNRSELTPYAAAVIDTFREANQIREERALLRADATTPNPQQANAGRLVALVPPEAGFYRVWASPSSDLALHLIADKIVAPGKVSSTEPTSAPAAAATSVTTGSETDLETAIDQPPLPAETADAVGPLKPILDSAGLQGLLEVQSARLYPDGVFVGNETVIVLLAATPWNEQAIRGLLPGQLLRISSRHLFIGNRAQMLDAASARLQQNQPPAAQQALAFAAFFKAGQEYKPYLQMMRMIDVARRPHQDSAPNAPRTPDFFSGNIGSLGTVFPRLDNSSLKRVDEGSRVKEQVIYSFTP